MALSRWRSHTSMSRASSGESAVTRNSSRWRVSSSRQQRDVVGRPDGQVGPGGAHHRGERDLGGRGQVDVALHRQLEHELAVLALADLQEGPVVGGPDVVALRVDEEDVGRLVPDLPAEDEGGGAVRAGRRQRGLVVRADRPPEPTDVQRGLEQVVRPWPGSRARPAGPGRARCGRAPPAWWPGCRPTRARRPGRAPGAARGACGRCRRCRCPRSCGCRPGRRVPRRGGGRGSRSWASIQRGGARQHQTRSRTHIRAATLDPSGRGRYIRRPRRVQLVPRAQGGGRDDRGAGGDDRRTGSG